MSLKSVESASVQPSRRLLGVAGERTTTTGTSSTRRWASPGRTRTPATPGTSAPREPANEPAVGAAAAPRRLPAALPEVGFDEPRRVDLFPQRGEVARVGPDRMGDALRDRQPFVVAVLPRIRTLLRLVGGDRRGAHGLRPRLPAVPRDRAHVVHAPL